MTTDEVKERIDFAHLADNLEAGDQGARDGLIDAVGISDQLQTELKELDAGLRSQKYTPEFVTREALRLRSEAAAKVRPLVERATTLAALADVTDQYLSPASVLRRARFEPAVGSEDANRRLLAEQVDLLRRADYSREVDSMDGVELASEVETAAREGGYAKLAILNRRIKREGVQHVNDAGWNAAKSAMISALEKLTTPDHALLSKAAKMRQSALEVLAYGELIATGKEPLRLHVRRVTENLRAGKTDLSAGTPYTIS
jgi:hypothetical protein